MAVTTQARSKVQRVDYTQHKVGTVVHDVRIIKCPTCGKRGRPRRFNGDMRLQVEHVNTIDHSGPFSITRAEAECWLPLEVAVLVATPEVLAEMRRDVMVGINRGDPKLRAKSVAQLQVIRAAYATRPGVYEDRTADRWCADHPCAAILVAGPRVTRPECLGCGVEPSYVEGQRLLPKLACRHHPTSSIVRIPGHSGLWCLDCAGPTPSLETSDWIVAQSEARIVGPNDL